MIVIYVRRAASVICKLYYANFEQTESGNSAGVAVLARRESNLPLYWANNVISNVMVLRTRGSEGVAFVASVSSSLCLFSFIPFPFSPARLMLQGWSPYNVLANFRESTPTCWLSDVFHHAFRLWTDQASDETDGSKLRIEFE